MHINRPPSHSPSFRSPLEPGKYHWKAGSLSCTVFLPPAHGAPSRASGCEDESIASAQRFLETSLDTDLSFTAPNSHILPIRRFLETSLDTDLSFTAPNSHILPIRRFLETSLDTDL
ncbi:hypothetical protein Bbelb_158430, partial [Branchiostoma belcheri]